MIRACVAAGVLVLAATACSSSGATEVLVPAVYDLAHDPSAGIAEVSPDRTDVLPAADLRLALEDLFVSHGITLVESMQAVVDGDDTATEVWIDALVGNTDDVVGAVGLVYGPVGADAFHQQWAQHTQFLVDYADAVRRGDDSAADEARARLASYADDSGSLLSTALGGALDADVAEDLLVQHIDHMIEQVDAHARGDDAEAARLSVEDNAHLVAVAGALTAGFAAQQPAAFPGTTDDPAALICSTTRRAAGDLAILALSGDDASLGDLEQAATDDMAAGLLTTVPDDLLDDIADAARDGDPAAAVSAVSAWRDAVRTATWPRP